MKESVQKKKKDRDTFRLCCYAGELESTNMHTGNRYVVHNESNIPTLVTTLYL